MKRLIAAGLLLAISLVVWNSLRDKHYAGDDDFIMDKNLLSPDGKNRVIEYSIDAGAFGEGRRRTAITPPEFEELNLVSYETPDCYETFGWTDANELIIAIENSPHLMKCASPHDYELKTGDTLQGVKVQIVDADEFLLKQGIMRGKTIPPPESK